MFRSEALESAGHRQYGTVVLTHSVGHSTLVVLFAGISIALIVFLGSFSITRKAHVPGTLLPRSGTIRVLTPQGGVVTERRVREGSSVTAGDALFTISSERTTSTRGEATTAVSALLQQRKTSLASDQKQQRQQWEHRIAANNLQAIELAAEAQRVAEQVSFQQRRVLLAEQTAQRYTELQRENFISAAGAQERLADLLDQRQRLSELQSAASANRRELARNAAERKHLEIQLERDEQAAMRDMLAIEQDLTENESRRLILIRAPQSGTVAAAM